MNFLINNTEELSELLTKNEVEAFDFTPSYPCIVVLDGNKAVACVSRGDFYTESADIVDSIIASLNWHNNKFDVTNPSQLAKLTRCQKFLTENMDALAALKGEALRVKISLEHKRMRIRASIKLAKRAEGESSTDAEAYARTMTETIDEDHATSAATYEELKGLYDRLDKTLMAIAQDRKAMESQKDRSLALPSI